jgi:ABC-type dipeptide/oligopeptide/nickel transport system permease subunit
LVLLVVGVNLVADGLRDLADPERVDKGLVR